MKLKHQKLYSAFFRETKTFYKIEDLKRLLKSNNSKEISLEHANYIYQKLLDENVVKACTKKQFSLNELNEEEIAEQEESDPSIINSNDKGFFFRFVGVVYVDDCVIKVYPKYINLNGDGNSSPDDFEDAKSDEREAVENHFKQTLRVIRKISKDSQSVSLNSQNKEKYNHIGMQIFLLEDYYRNGIYENKETVIETNGEGEIDWNKTINETTAIIKNNKPYYVELQTVNTRSNDFDYFKLLHESVLCECSRTLRDTGLLDYLGMIPCELNGMELASFGDINYIKYRLQQELRTQFVTRKRNQLTSLLSYITETTSYKNSNTLKLFGSYHFEHIWEVVCKAVFNDLYDNKYRIGNSKLDASPTIQKMLNNGLLKEIKDVDRIDKKSTLKDLIEKVEWNMNGVPCKTDGNLTPDIISIDEQENFYVLDAKYYILKVKPESKQIQNNPGIQDVLKQFAYERAYNDFLRDYRFFHTLNAFIMPLSFSEWDYEEKGKFLCHKGSVNYKLMQNASYNLLGPIQILETSPSYLFENFLEEKSCLKALTKIAGDTGILNTINNFRNSDGVDYGLTMTGFIRSSYMKNIKNEKSFWFYFYVSKDSREIEIHPELLNCSKFIGYEDKNLNNEIIRGTVLPEIRKVTGKQLRELVKDKKSSPDKDWYYCMKIENVYFESFSDEQYIALLEKINKAPGNHLIEKYAPKVIK